MPFQKGNAGGPGRPKGRKNLIRRELIDRGISDANTVKILRSIVKAALDGDVPAAKMALEFKLGKPHQTHDLGVQAEITEESPFTDADIDRVLASAICLVDNSTTEQIDAARAAMSCQGKRSDNPEVT